MCVMFTDADKGFGGFITSRLNDIICCEKFSHNEKQISSTYRELVAVKYVLSSFCYILKNQSIQVNTVNSTVLVKF